MGRIAREKSIQSVKDWARVFHYPAYRTAILGEMPHTFRVVTRVNYSTSCLWLQWRNQQVKNGSKGIVQLPTDKPNWLVMNRYFKRKQERRIKVMAYLEERKKRIENG